MTTAEVEHLEQLIRLEGREPDVDEDARWGLTVAGLRALGVVILEGFHDEPVRWVSFKNQRGGRWVLEPR